MQPEFWHERWQSQRIGFHQNQVMPLLQKHWPSLGLPTGSQVFVPLAGKSLDMAWLAAQGHRVLGVELSPEFAPQPATMGACRTFNGRAGNWSKIAKIGRVRACNRFTKPVGGKASFRATDRPAGQARWRRQGHPLSSQRNTTGGPVRGSRRAVLSLSVAALPLTCVRPYAALAAPCHEQRQDH